MSMYGKYPKVLNAKGEWVEQNGLNGAPKAWPTTDCSKDIRLTSQAPRDEVDINKIVKKMERGQLVDVNTKQGQFMDVSEFDGLADAVIKVQKANEDFFRLPASLREEFDNDPVKLVEFMADEANLDRAIELGLVAADAKEIKAGEPEPVPPATGDAK